MDIQRIAIDTMAGELQQQRNDAHWRSVQLAQEFAICRAQLKAAQAANKKLLAIAKAAGLRIDAELNVTDVAPAKAEPPQPEPQAEEEPVE
jgi:hypothetical protein